MFAADVLRSLVQIAFGIALLTTFALMVLFLWRDARKASVTQSAFLLVRSSRHIEPMQNQLLELGNLTEIGNAVWTDIFVPDNHISAVEARIVQRTGVWMVEAAHQGASVWLNGTRVGPFVPLRRNQRLRVGDVDFEFRTY